MERRAFITLAGGFLAGPLAAEAQQTGKVYRIGFLRQGSPPRPWVEAFQQGLQELGYVQGRNVVVEFRLTDGSLDQLPQLAEELVRLRVDVILASAASAALAAKRATTSVPIVFTGVYDPVEIGLVASLGHPGGNITGLAVNASDMAGKRLQLLRELIPKAKRVAMLSHPPHPTNARQLEGAEPVARALGVQLEAVPVRGADDFDSALKALRGIDGLLHADTPLFTTHRARLAEVVARRRLPTIFSLRGYVDVGGLMSYGADQPDLFRRAATYIDKVLKGAKPADLPVAEPTKFELVINLETAKALGLTIPQSLLQRADQVIE